MLVGEAVDKLCPVYFMEGFSNPALERANISMVTSGTLANRRHRFLMM
jgi:hypothetical protein